LKSYSSIIAFISILALMVVPIYHIQSGNQDYLNIVTKSFQVTKADFDALNIQAWAQINKKGLSHEDLKNIYSQIVASMKIINNPTINDDYEDFISLYQNETIDTTSIEIALQSFPTQGQEAGTFLGIQVNSKDFETSKNYYQIISELFSNLNIKTDIGITVIGTYPGYLREEERYRTIALGFAAVNAQVVEGVNTEELISFSAYTKNCSQYLDVDGKKINLNIAVRYHALDNKTYIHIGAPLIFQEY